MSLGTIINTTARCGDLSIIQTLESQGAWPTGDTLASAVSSGNLDLVKSFLRTCKIDSVGPLEVTPLTVAIYLKDQMMMKVLEEHGASDHLARKDQFASALRATYGASDLDFLLRLINLGSKVTLEELVIAVLALVKGGHDEAAYLLIDAGANLDTQSQREGGPALREARSRRNE
jgi:hypothetical protein